MTKNCWLARNVSKRQRSKLHSTFRSWIFQKTNSRKSSQFLTELRLKMRLRLGRQVNKTLEMMKSKILIWIQFHQVQFLPHLFKLSLSIQISTFKSRKCKNHQKNWIKAFMKKNWLTNRASSLFSIMKTVHSILTHSQLVIHSSPICHTNLISIL